MTDLPTDFEDGVGDVVDAAWHNLVGTNVNANTAAIAELNGRFGSLTEPPSTGWTAVNLQPGWSWASSGSDLLFTAPTAGLQLGYEYRAYPSPSFTLTAQIEAQVAKLGTVAPTGNSLGEVGIVVSDGTKSYLFGPSFVNSSAGGFGPVGGYLVGCKFVSNGGLASYFTQTPAAYIGGLPQWVRVIDNNTDLAFQYSLNGSDFQTVYAEPRTTFLTPSRIGIGAVNFTGLELLARVRSWTT